MLAPRVCKRWTGGELGSVPAFGEGDDVWFLFPWSNKIWKVNSAYGWSRVQREQLDAHWNIWSTDACVQMWSTLCSCKSHFAVRSGSVLTASQHRDCFVPSPATLCAFRAAHAAGTGTSSGVMSTKSLNCAQPVRSVTWMWSKGQVRHRAGVTEWHQSGLGWKGPIKVI